MPNRIKELRKAQGYTLDELAEATGIKRGTLSNYELGKTEPKIKTWERLAITFGTSISYLQGLKSSFENEKTYSKYLFNLFLSELEQFRDVPEDEYEKNSILFPTISKSSRADSLKTQAYVGIMTAYLSMEHESFNTPSEFVNSVERFYLSHESELLEYLPDFKFVTKDDPYDITRLVESAREFFMRLPVSTALNDKYAEVGNDFINQFESFINSFIESEPQLKGEDELIESGKGSGNNSRLAIISELNGLKDTIYERLGAEYNEKKDTWYFGKNS